MRIAQTIERPSEALQSLIATKGYAFVAELPGGFGEKLFVHSTVPGGVAAVSERVKSLMQKAEAARLKKHG